MDNPTIRNLLTGEDEPVDMSCGWMLDLPGPHLDLARQMQIEEQRAWQGIAECLKGRPIEEVRAYVKGLGKQLLPPEVYQELYPDE